MNKYMLLAIAIAWAALLGFAMNADEGQVMIITLLVWMFLEDSK